MTTENRRDTVSLVNQFGAFVPLSDDDLATMTEADRADYEAVHVAFSEVATTERKIEVATKKLRDTVVELREAERAVAAMPGPSRIDLVRQMIRQTAGH